MFKKNSSFLVLLTIVAICFLMWYFSELVIIILISVILSLIGQPLIRLFDRIKFRKAHFPHTLSTVLSLIVIICLFAGFFRILLQVAEESLILRGTLLAFVEPRKGREKILDRAD